MQNNPDSRFTDFIRDHHILTLAISRDGIPWCATCYYAYSEENNHFIYTSGPETRHVSDMIASGSNHVAGTIALETRIVGKIRGLQFAGIVYEPTGEKLVQARKRYLKRFPVARLVPGLHLWILKPRLMKLTDNRLGFGTKLHWQENP